MLLVSGLVGVLSAVALATAVVRASRSVETPMQAVVRVTHYLPAGTLVEAQDVRVVLLPANSPALPSGAVTSLTQAVGAVTSRGVPEGALLTGSDLQRLPIAGPIARYLVPGHVIITVPATIAPGALSAGDVVDVYAVTSAPGGAAASASLVATGVPVLGVLNGGQYVTFSTPSGGLFGSTGSTGGSASLLLSVTPDEAATIFAAVRSGTVDVALDPLHVAAEPPPMLPTPQPGRRGGAGR
jgi:Flp pilus assembly protein CpaB